MPRGSSSKPASELHKAAQRALWELGADLHTNSYIDLDPKPVPFIQALIKILGSGSAIFMRASNDGHSMGIAIWEGDTRHKMLWFSETEALDEWATRVNAVQTD